MRFALAFLLPVAALAADAVYHGGKIVTLWDKRPIAQAIAVRDGRILAVGSDAEVFKAAGAGAKRIDLRGRTVLPGLIDSHTHPITAALSEIDGPVPVIRSIPELQAYIRRRAEVTPRDRTILVPKVYATRLKERRYPTRYELDAAAADRAVISDNGYAAVVNSFVLARMGIGRDTPQPKNGKIIKDEKGEPTGLILGAPDLLRAERNARPITHADRLWAVREMQKAYNRVGITSTIDRGQRAEGFRAYQELARKGELTVRTYVTYTIGAQGTPEDVRREIESIPFVTGFGDEWLRIGSLKTVLDGGILIGTAYLREPYGSNTKVYGYDDPDYRGVFNVSKENLAEMARTANRLGWQMTAHATGGGAVDLLLNAYEAADRDSPIRGRRFTVSHGNFPNAEAIARARKLGVVFDCQPPWLHLDGPVLKDVFGPNRIRDFLPLLSMQRAGVMVAGGSDHMIRFDSREAINPYNPFFGMWMAITRQTVDGAVLGPEQRLERLDALRLWTVNGAYLSFEEDLKGSLEPGKLADFVVISKDFLGCPVQEIKDIEVSATVVGGKVVYEKRFAE